VPAVILVILVAIASSYLNIHVSVFTRDPLAVAGGKPYFGLLSNLGVILWSATAAMCFFSYAILKTIKRLTEMPKFILFGGLFSLLLLFDDLFMFHEKVYPNYLGIGEKIVFLSYGMLFAAYLVYFRKTIMKANYDYLSFAAFFFALAILVDILPLNHLLPMYYLFEDGPKFLGIVSWFGYQLSICFKEVASVAGIAEKETAAESGSI
jgi:hypothetical protein